MPFELVEDQTENHRCHWVGCQKNVPPRLWGCKPHWMALPFEIRIDILRAYVPGQEIRRDPSEAYIKAAMAARTWILLVQGSEHDDR